MLTKKFFAGILFGLTVLPQLGYTLDTDVYRETTIESSPRILLLVDTSGSMRCASDPNNTEFDLDSCSSMRIAGGREINTGSEIIDSGLFKVDTPYLSRMDVIKRILNDFIAEDGASPWPDTFQVGLSVMSRPGAAIIQPVRSLDTEVTDEAGNNTIDDGGITRPLTSRDVLVREIEALSGSGTTPTLGSIFEAGMYMAGLPVVTGVSRKFVDTEEGKLDKKGFSDGSAANWLRVQNKRISSPSTFSGGAISPTRNASGTKSACQQAMDLYGPEYGRFTDACSDEEISLSGNPTYIKPTPSPIACADGGDHVVLITDGYPRFYTLGDKVRDGVKLGTWVKRFIQENISDSGFHAD